MDEYESDEYEAEGYQLRGREPKKTPWCGAASMMFGALAFGTAFLSYLVGSMMAKAFKPLRGNDDGAFQFYLIATAITILITVGSAFGSVVCGLIALVRGERSQWLLLPGLLWLSFVLLCGLLALMLVVRRFV